MFKKYYYEGKITNYSVSDDGQVRNDFTHQILEGSYLSCEYHKVQLTIEGSFKTLLVHRMVAETFLENPDYLPVVHHIDGNKTNNNVNNLQWVTVQQNSVTGRVSRPTQYNVFIDENDDNWKDIPGIPGYKAGKNGKIYNVKGHRILSGSYRNGYLRATLHGRVYSIHKLIYETFVEKIPNGMVIDHINGKRDDNRLENLRCVTQSENMHNAQKNGHKGQNRVAQYDLDYNFIKEFASCTEAAKEMGVTYRAISSAADRGGTSCGFYWEKI